MTTEVAKLAGGCFWCTEAVFVELKGVIAVESGYIGGARPSPSYEAVCTGTTGHAEAVRVTFDPAQVSYADLLDIFFHTHDPTTLNRQGGDAGTQYRSAIFPNSPEQAAEAKAAVVRNQADWDAPIVTSIEADAPWYKAEAYHQDYFINHPLQSYCAFVVAPKVAKFRKIFTDKLRR